MATSKEPVHLRFQAVVIASQLPHNTAEALLVLDYARHMVAELLHDPSGVTDNVHRVSGTLETQPVVPPLVRDLFTVQDAGCTEFAESDFLQVATGGREFDSAPSPAKQAAAGCNRVME